MSAEQNRSGGPGLEGCSVVCDSVTLGKRFHLSEPQFYHWKSEGLLKQSVVVGLPNVNLCWVVGTQGKQPLFGNFGFLLSSWNTGIPPLRVWSQGESSSAYSNNNDRVLCTVLFHSFIHSTNLQWKWYCRTHFTDKKLRLV